MSFQEENQPILRTKDDIVAAMMAQIIEAVPDAYLDEDSILRLLLETQGGQLESVYMAIQVLREDMWVQTANVQALELYGDEVGVPRKGGSRATGELRFTGRAGTFIPVDTEVSHDPGTGEENILVYFTSEDGTIPDPGVPAAPIVADSGISPGQTGTFEYTVTFLTLEGETVPGATSEQITVADRRIALSAIPLGGAGTTGRRIYRREVGGSFQRVTTINDNVATTYQDNISPGSLGSAPPTVDTAHAVRLDALAEETGVAYNVVINSIDQLNDVPDGISGVTNPIVFSGGLDEEDLERFRQRVIDHLQAPGTGSPLDVKTWVEELEGVESATVFSNDNLGVATNGHVTVRVSGPGGTIPPQSVIDAVQDVLDSKGLAQITYHAAAFDALSTDVTVTVTPSDGFVLLDVAPSVENAIENYINNLAVGGTLYVAGIYDAVFGLPGIDTLTVTTPASDLTTPAASKRVPGTITVN